MARWLLAWAVFVSDVHNALLVSVYFAAFCFAVCSFCKHHLGQKRAFLWALKSYSTT